MLRKLFKSKRCHLCSVFIADVNGVRHEFASKQTMLDWISSYRSEHNEIQSLSIYRCEIYSLIP